MSRCTRLDKLDTNVKFIQTWYKRNFFYAGMFKIKNKINYITYVYGIDKVDSLMIYLKSCIKWYDTSSVKWK